MQALSDFLGVALPIPDARAADDAMAGDLFRYMVDPRSTRGFTTDAQLGVMLRTLREEPRVRQLLHRLNKSTAARKPG
jgi:hypothetical protein